MDLNEIKSIIKIDGGKFIIVENDKPSLVVISFEDYKKHLRKTEASQDDQSQSLFGDTQDAEQDSNDKKSEDAEEEKFAFAKASPSAPAGATEDKTADKTADKESDNELTIDDLPL